MRTDENVFPEGDDTEDWLNQAVAWSRRSYEKSIKSALTRNVYRHLPEAREADIVDLGCGQGHLVQLLVERGYGRVRGIDVSPEQVAIARRRGLDMIERAELFEYLGTHRDSFDAIVAMDVLEHFDKPNILGALDAIFAALRPGGKLVAQVPNAGGPFGSRYRYWDFTHGTAFTTFSARQVSRTAGFRQVELFAVEPVPHGLLSAGRFVLWKLISSAFKGILTVETGVVRGHIVTQNLVFVATK